MKRQPGISSILVVLFFSLSVTYGGCSSREGNISPSAAHAFLARDTTTIALDVRTSEEYRGESGHVPGAVLIPVQELEGRLDELAPFKGRLIIAYCRSGHRSTAASQILRDHGFNVLNMEGGITRWREEGFPVILAETQGP